MNVYSLSNEDIVLACEEVESFLKASRIGRREALTIKLTFEEVLLEYSEKFGKDATYKLKCTKKFSSPRIEFVFKGEDFNPLDKEDNNGLIGSLLSKAGIAPEWSYKNGKNYISFMPKKEALSATKRIFLSVLLSVISGLLIGALPSGISSFITENILTSLTNIFMDLIATISCPLVFLSVLGSICSMGDMETFGKIGKKTFASILMYAAVTGAALTVIASLFFDVSLGGGAGADFSKVLDMIYDIVPPNLVEPFATGNVLQIIFIAIIFGVGMLVLSSRVSAVFGIVEQLSSLMQTIMEMISAFLPYVVFIIFTNIIATRNFDNIIGSWKMILIMMLLLVVLFVGMILWVSIRQKVSPKTLFKKIFPTLAIVLTTASPAAAFATNIEDSEKKLGINPKMLVFGSALGQALFKPCVFVLFCTVQLGFAESYGMDITISWIILGYLTNLLLSIAISPASGGAIMGITVAFIQLGIPLEVMGIVIAFDALLDFPGTATDTVGWQVLMVDVADSLDLLDKETLRRDE